MLDNVSEPDEIRAAYARIVSARARQVALRKERTQRLTRLLEYLRARLADFLSETDPITGTRLLDIGSEENRSQAGMAVIIAGFDGSRLKIAVDARGRYTYASVPDVFAGIANILSVRVGEDLSYAEFDYTPTGEDTAYQTNTIDSLVIALLDRAAAAVEAEVDDTL